MTCSGQAANCNSAAFPTLKNPPGFINQRANQYKFWLRVPFEKWNVFWKTDGQLNSSELNRTIKWNRKSELLPLAYVRGSCQLNSPLLANASEGQEIRIRMGKIRCWWDWGRNELQEQTSHHQQHHHIASSTRAFTISQLQHDLRKLLNLKDGEVPSSPTR